VDDGAVRRDASLPADSADPAIDDDDGLVGQHAFGGKRHHIDVHEYQGWGSGDGAGQRGQAEREGDEQTGHGHALLPLEGRGVGRLPRMFGPTLLGRNGRPATRRLEAANCGWRAPTYGQVLLLDDFVAHRAAGPRLELPRCKHPGPPARPWRREAGPPTPRADQPCPGRIQRARVPNSATTSMGLATWSFIPAARARSRSATSAFAVMAITGSACHFGSARSARVVA